MQDNHKTQPGRDKITPLVLNTKLSSNSKKQACFVCSVSNKAEKANLSDQKKSAVQIRYKRLSMARKILTNNGHTKHRIGLCKRYLKAGANNAELNFSLKHNSASFRNLISCGSVWVCPVCSAKVTERRREELLTALAKNDNYHYYLVTYTLGHKKYDFLTVLLDRLAYAIGRTKAGCRWQKFREYIGYVGTISTLEVTFNPKYNGWHPHYHMLLITEKNIREKEIKEYFSSIYIKALNKIGGYATEEIAVDVQYAREKEEAAGYILKWGVMEEVTRSHIKKAGGGGFSAFELLDIAEETGEFWAIEAFKEFAEATKGKRLLSFSKGLNSILGIKDRKDEVIAEEEEEQAENITLARFYNNDLIVIREHNLQGMILHLANKKDFANLKELFIDYGIGVINKQFFDDG